MPERDHLLVVATNFRESHGGVQAHLAQLSPRLVERGIRTTVVYLGRRTRPEVVDGVRVLPLRRRADVRDVLGVPDPAQWRRFTAAVASGKLPEGPVTAVATHTRFFPMSALGIRLAARLGVPVVHTEHGAGSVVTGSPLVETASRAVDLSMGRWVLRTADRVVAVSSGTARFVQQLAGVSCTLVPNGIDVDRWLPRGSDTVAPAPRPLVFVGRVVREKGWRDFLDVAAAVRAATGVPRPVHVVGDGPDTGAARAYAAGLGLEVQCHGRLGQEAIRPLLTGAVYVNPSVAAEGFQLTQLEALVAGAAVVSYDVGVARELAASGVGHVDVVPPGDVRSLAAAAAEAVTATWPAPRRQQVRRWDWDTVAGAYAAVLEAARSGSAA